jgi:sigma-B regulation protein RsbU (phosphoserine phosphatase)
VAGALVSVALGGLSRRLRREFDSLGFNTSAEVLCWFNQEVLNLNLEQHITMFVGILDDKLKVMQYSSAAHFPCAILKNKRGTAFLEMGGLPLGMCETQYGFQDVDIAENFDLVLFSDGVLEIMSQTYIKDKEQYLLSLVQLHTTDIDTLVGHLEMEGRKNVPDDIAIFTVARNS